MFRLIEPSSGQIKNIRVVLVNSVSAHIMGSHTVYCALTACTSTMFVFGLMISQCAETCRRIFNIDYQYTRVCAQPTLNIYGAQPTLNIYTGLIPSQLTTNTSGCYYSL